MKRFLPILFLFVAFSAMAGNISQEEALKKAQAFIASRSNTQHKMRLAAKSTQVNTKLTTAAQESYYVFNVGERNGYVVVSGDDRTPAILGYADEGTFDAERIPENMRAWLQGYADQLAYLASHKKSEVSTPTDHPAISPLIKSTWNQDEPYNNLCPLDKDDNKRSVTGCVAVSIGQIINFHQYPAKTAKTIPSYTTYTKGISVDAIRSTTIDWDNMLNNYRGNETTAQKQAVANLLALCGAALQMDYTSGTSSAISNNVPIALKEYFDYDDATRLIFRDDYRACDWDSIVYNELANRRPMYYSGSTSGGGHAFIVDGYDKDGLYHVNWGWGGSSNGYYLLSILDPDSNSGIGASSSTDGYSFGQDAVIGIQPNTGEPYHPEVKMTIESISTNQTTVTKTDGVFPITYTAEVRNYMENTHTFTLGVGVYNENNELVYSQIQREIELKTRYGFSSMQHKCNIPTLPDGNYIITSISREKGTDKWYQDKGAYKYFLTATIKGNTITLQNPTVDLSGSITTAGNMEAKSIMTVTATIKNNGSFCNETLFLLVNGENMGGRYFEAEAGETKTLEMAFYPETVGSNNIIIARESLVYMEDQQQWVEQYIEVASTSVDVKSPSSYSLTLSNAKVENATNKKINDKVALLSFTVKNNGTKAYNEDICIYSLLKNLNNIYYNYVFTKNEPVMLAPQESKQMQVEIPLQTDGTYWFGVVYKSDGEFYDINDGKSLSLFPYQVVVPNEPDPIELSIQKTEAEKLKNGHSFFNLNGQKVNKPQRGLYIINGRKVVIK